MQSFKILLSTWILLCCWRCWRADAFLLNLQEEPLQLSITRNGFRTTRTLEAIPRRPGDKHCGIIDATFLLYRDGYMHGGIPTACPIYRILFHSFNLGQYCIAEFDCDLFGSLSVYETGNPSLMFDGESNLYHVIESPVVGPHNIGTYGSNLVACPPTQDSVDCSEVGKVKCLSVLSKGSAMCKEVSIRPSENFSAVHTPKKTASLGSDLTFNPISEVTGKNLFFPDFKRSDGTRIIYDEKNMVIWSQHKKLVTNDDSDDITIVENIEFTIPPVMNSQTEAVVDKLKEYGIVVSSKFGGLFGKFGCAIDSIFGSKCDSGSSKKSTTDLSNSIQAADDAITKQGQAIKAVVAREDTLNSVVKNVKRATSENTKEIEKQRVFFTGELNGLASQLNEDSSKILYLISNNSEVDGWIRDTNSKLLDVGELMDITKRVGSSVPYSSSIYKKYSGSLRVGSVSYTMSDCSISSSIFDIDGNEFSSVTKLICSKSYSSEQIFIPAKIELSLNGKSLASTNPLIMEYALILRGSSLTKCDGSHRIGDLTYDIKPIDLINDTSDGMCVSSHAMVVDRSDLALCRNTESTVSCYNHQLPRRTPPFLDDGPMFPFGNISKSTARTAPFDRPIYPYVSMTAETIMTTVPSYVYLPPYVDGHYPAGSLITKSKEPGKISPIPALYQDTEWASIDIPADSLSSQITLNRTFYVQSLPDPDAGRIHGEIIKDTQFFLSNLFNKSKNMRDAFETITNQINKNFSSEESKFKAEEKHILDLVKESQQDVNKSRTLANKALDALTDNIIPIGIGASILTLFNTIGSILGIIAFSKVKKVKADMDVSDDLDTLMSNLAVMLALIVLFITCYKRTLSKSIKLSLPFITHLIATNVNAVDFSDPQTHVNWARRVLPWIMMSTMCFMFTTLTVKLILRICCKRTDSKKKLLKFISLLLMMMTVITTVFYVLSSQVDLSKISNWMDHDVVLVYNIIVQSLGALGYFLVLANAAPIGPMTNKPTPQPASSTPFPSTIHYEHLFYAFLALWLVTLLALIIVCLILLCLKKKKMPDDWIASRTSKIKSLRSKCHPVGVKISCVESTLNNENNPRLLMTVHVGWIETLTLHKVILPGSRHKKAKSILLGVGAHGISMKNFPDPSYTDYKFDSVVIFREGKEQVVPCELTMSNVTNNDKYVRTQKSTYKSLMAEYQDVDDVNLLGGQNIVKTAPKKEQMTLSEFKKGKNGWKGTRPPINKIIKDNMISLDQDTYVKLLVFGMENQVETPESISTYQGALNDTGTLKAYLAKLGYMLSPAVKPSRPSAPPANY